MLEAGTTALGTPLRIAAGVGSYGNDCIAWPTRGGMSMVAVVIELFGSAPRDCGLKAASSTALGWPEEADVVGPA
jgi:hypothetical protein